MLYLLKLIVYKHTIIKFQKKMIKNEDVEGFLNY